MKEIFFKYKKFFYIAALLVFLLGSFSSRDIKNVSAQTAPTVSVSQDGVTASGAVFSVKVTDPDNTISNLFSLIFNYGTSTDITKMSVGPTPVASGKGANYIEEDLINLNPSTTYYYNITDANGTPISGGTGNFNTNAPGSDNVQLTSSNVTVSTAKITASFPYGMVPVNVVVYYQAGNTVDDVGGNAYSQIMTCSGQTCTANLSSPELVAGTKYSYKILLTPAGTWTQDQLGGVQNFTTLSSGSGAISVSGLTQDSATINLVISATGISYPINLSYGTNTSAMSAPITMDSSATTSGTLYSKTISLLTPNTLYYYTIQNTSSSPAVIYGGGIQQFTTLAPVVPGVPYVGDVTGNTATIKLNVPTTVSSIGQLQIYYGINASPLNSGPVTMTGSGYDYVGQVISNATGTFHFIVKDSGTGAVYGNPNTLTFTITDLTNPSPSSSPTFLKTIVDTSSPANNSVASADYTGGIVKCTDPMGNPTDPKVCNFNSLMLMVNRAIGFMIWVLAPAIMACMIAYGGFLYLFSGGGEGKAKGNKIMLNAFVGWLLAMAAWIIVRFVMEGLGYQVNLFPVFWN